VARCPQCCIAPPDLLVAVAEHGGESDLPGKKVRGEGNKAVADTAVNEAYDPKHDNGGVHINSGIPNRAFYLAATGIGGPAWEHAGRIWYVTLTQHLEASSDFRAAADATIAVAGELFGAASHERQTVSEAWKEVGVL
jgi:Zn-dependent metalloprotease